MVGYARLMAKRALMKQTTTQPSFYLRNLGAIVLCARRVASQNGHKRERPVAVRRRDFDLDPNQ